MAWKHAFRVVKISSRVWLAPMRKFHFPHSAPRKADLVSVFPIQMMKMPVRGIRLTNPNRANPFLIIIMQRVMQITAIIFGRKLRKVWKRLSEKERKALKRGFIERRFALLKFVLLFLLPVFLIVYLINLVETPYSKRKRFMLINHDEMKEFGKKMGPSLLDKYKQYIFPHFHPSYLRTHRVLSNLIESNSDLPEIRKYQWRVFVVNNPDCVNAFGVPNGDIYVFSGILNLCSNDDQLAVVLSHEISHIILSHTAEMISSDFLANIPFIISITLGWSLFDFLWAAMYHWFCSGMTSLIVNFPMNRICEREADLIGIQLAARSCYDVREAPRFWQKMHQIQGSYPDWISTHSNPKTRMKEFKAFMPTALKLRSQANCDSFKSFLKIFSS